MDACAIHYCAVRLLHCRLPLIGRYDMHGTQQRPRAVALRAVGLQPGYGKEMSAASK